MRNVICLSGAVLALGCGSKEEEGTPSTNKCETTFELEFTDADGGTEFVEMPACGGVDLDAGFEWTDDAHLRYMGVAMQAKTGGNCYVAIVIDPYCGEDEAGRPFVIGGPDGWDAKVTLVLDDCPDMPEGGATTWALQEGEVDLVVGFKHPGDTPGKAIRTAPVGTISGSATEDGMTISVQGAFKIDRKTTAGEVEESICD